MTPTVEQQLSTIPGKRERKLLFESEKNLKYLVK